MLTRTDYQNKRLKIVQSITIRLDNGSDVTISFFALRHIVQRWQNVLDSTQNPDTLEWITPQLNTLKDRLQHLNQSREASSANVNVLKYKEDKHLLDYGSHREWHDLSTLRFEEIDDEWTCGLMSFEDREKHEAEKCIYRLVHCPLGCGQQMEHRFLHNHMEKRCNLRLVPCRLGCGSTNAYSDLLIHEDQHCMYRCD